MDAPNTIPWPPIISLIAIICGFSADYLFPLPWAPAPISDFLFALGLLILLTAAYLYYASFRLFNQNDTTISPVKSASVLVTSGPFSISRNPIYLANVLVAVGLAAIFGKLWLLVFAIVLAILLQRLAILPEEKHLELRFGKQWRAYRKKVRRWI